MGCNPPFVPWAASCQTSGHSATKRAIKTNEVKTLTEKDLDQDWCHQLLLRACRWLEAKLYKLLSPRVSENKLRYLCPSTKILRVSILQDFSVPFRSKAQSSFPGLMTSVALSVWTDFPPPIDFFDAHSQSGTLKSFRPKQSFTVMFMMR